MRPLTVDVGRVVNMLDVRLAWRPWRRRRLTPHELQRVEGALVAGGWMVLQPVTLPRRLSARVTIMQAPERSGGDRGASARILPKLIGAVGSFVSFLGAAVGLWLLVFPASHPPPALSGEMNIGVLPFRAHGFDAAAAQPAATALSHNVAASLQADVHRSDPSTTVDVHALSGAPPPNAWRRPAALAALAARTNADALIFGDVDETRDGAVVTPYVYLAPRSLPQTSEASGVYRLGSPLLLPVLLGTSAPAVGELRRMIVARARGPAELVDAVGWYVLDRFGTAAVHLRAAAAIRGWADPRALAIVDLLLGNTTAKLAGRSSVRLSVAQAHYRAALAQAPGFARARFGLAEVTFQRAHGDCTRRSVKLPLMREALAQYRAVPHSSWRPREPLEAYELVTKVHFGVGRVFLCLSQAQLTSGWETAQRELTLVSRADQHDGALRDDAAEASADLAIAQLPRSGERHARRHYLAALASYTRAIERTRDVTALPALYANRAFVEARLGQRAAAAADRRTAAQEAHAAQRAGLGVGTIF